MLPKKYEKPQLNLSQLYANVKYIKHQSIHQIISL